ncbi:alanine racemase [Tropicibacter naphthalenivorans]|uniref:Lysine/arginine racemase n=1 Tax=Tropicibacter naphthalenivorans TaxID=441103 RepID=A0A0P1GIY9_9RHOB|nr:Lysine/arginine racemase precursor [Tropicibacter naphthalenivorans]SMD08238.1 alanine racemase [Tropicibacter naphthalenivorans]
MQGAQHLRGLRYVGRNAAPVHLALNSGGMARDCIDVTRPEGQAACAAILRLLGGQIAGICTHFANNAPEALARSAALFQSHAAWAIDAGAVPL